MGVWALLATSWAVGFSGAVAPGPLLVACVTHSARSGFRGGLLTTVGHALMELGVVVALVLGLGGLLTRPGVSLAVSLVGGAVLVWMGLTTARNAFRADMNLPYGEHTGFRNVRAGCAAAVEAAPVLAAGGPDPDRAGGRAPAAPAVLAGVFATVSGPYWILWWATVGLSYLSLADPLGAAGVGAFYLGHIGADFAWYAVVAAAVAGGRRLLTVTGYRWLLGACGLCLLGLGGFFAGRSLTALLGL